MNRVTITFSKGQGDGYHGKLTKKSFDNDFNNFIDDGLFNSFPYRRIEKLNAFGIFDEKTIEKLFKEGTIKNRKEFELSLKITGITTKLAKHGDDIVMMLYLENYQKNVFINQHKTFSPNVVIGLFPVNLTEDQKNKLNGHQAALGKKLEEIGGNKIENKFLGK